MSAPPLMSQDFLVSFDSQGNRRIGGQSVFISDEIDLTVATNPPTVPAVVLVGGKAGQTFVCTGGAIVTTDASGTLTSAATIEMGFTGAPAGFLASSNTRTGATAFNAGVPGFATPFTPLAVLAGPGLDLSLTVTVAAVLGVSSTFKIRVVLIGVYV